jgi:hypothetical protein
MKRIGEQAPPTRLLHPAVVLRVIAGNLFRRPGGNANVSQAAAGS